MSGTAQAPSFAQSGWRFGIGILLVAGGYVAWALIPLVAGADLSMGLKTPLTGFLAVMPVLTKVAAIAVMGKPGFNLLKTYVFNFLGRFRPAEQVSQGRYRIGLVLFVLSLVFSSLLPYFPGIFVDWEANEKFWSLAADAVLIASLFVLGGEFWNKLAALFDYNAKVSTQDDRGA
ncbi:hypothetical protein [Dongia deserti]|uniref:hypothetical protein n=1 Tax=Dongia deserti TaxID=2268030 RepID=UPI000E64FD74|nr:hypothetical protein [Dongia deserti]